MKRISRLGAVIAFAMLAVLSAVPMTHVHAQDQGGQAIQISPVLVELNADSGQSYKIKLTLTNISSGSLVLLPEVNDFKAKDESGSPEIIFDTSEDAGSYSMKTWISGLPRLVLKSKESRTVEVNVAVPKGAEPGGHYAVARYSGISPELENTGVALSASVGVLILGRVSGDVNESLAVEQFFVEQGGKQRSLLEKTPFMFVERIKNSGSVHLKPTGDVTVKNMFGSKVATLPINDPAKNVLPDSIRRFEQELSGKFMIGRYTAEMSLAYGTAGQVLQSSTSFWVIPYKLIAVCLLALIAIIFIGRIMIKRYNRRIIQRSKRR